MSERFASALHGDDSSSRATGRPRSSAPSSTSRSSSVCSSACARSASSSFAWRWCADDARRRSTSTSCWRRCAAVTRRLSGTLVRSYHAPLRRLALGYRAQPGGRGRGRPGDVARRRSAAFATFEGRSSLQAPGSSASSRTRRRRGPSARGERCRCRRFASDDDDPSVDPTRFFDQQHDRWPGHWASPPARWDEVPGGAPRGTRDARRARSRDRRACPPSQKQVIVLRDIEGWPAEEVCDLLGLSDGNQRVCLHRARSRVRQALEDELGSFASLA